MTTLVIRATKLKSDTLQKKQKLTCKNTESQTSVWYKTSSEKWTLLLRLLFFTAENRSFLKSLLVAGKLFRSMKKIWHQTLINQQQDGFTLLVFVQIKCVRYKMLMSELSRCWWADFITAAQSQDGCFTCSLFCAKPAGCFKFKFHANDFKVPCYY